VSAVLDPQAVVGIVGAGAMGAGIAQVALRNRHRVLLADADAGALERARSAIEGGFRREVDKGRLTEPEADRALGRLVAVDPASGLSAFGEAKLVIEAIVERLDAKQSIFRALGPIVAPVCVLATNTSSLSVASIGAVIPSPERFLGIHFFNPAPLMPLVEVVPGVRTNDAVLRDTRAFIESWGKTTVVAADTPGFIVNRIARPFYGEALRMLEEGVADAVTIDWSLRELGGFRMGPFELMDFIGHDVNYVVTESVWTAMYYDSRYRPSLTQKRLLEAGLLGRKTGQGFYDYADDAVRPEPSRDAALGGAIVHRILAMLVNEAADAVFLGIASPADVETAMQRGVNYPKGLLAWGNEVGPARILEELDRLRTESGEDRYRASQLLRRCVREGRPLPT
jgi:3-hydroxybutyryl-CoA dehydrogenase